MLYPAFPQISNHDLEQRNVFESLSTSYFVDATGIPRPTATWYKDGQVLTSSDRVKISDEGETYRLELLDLVMDDAGVYKCKISNRLGEKSQEAKLELTSEYLLNFLRRWIAHTSLNFLKLLKAHL